MDKNGRDDQHPLPTVRPTDFVCQPGGSDAELTLDSSPYVMVQRSLVCVVTVLGLLALFAEPVIGAEWDDPSPPSRNLETTRL